MKSKVYLLSLVFLVSSQAIAMSKRQPDPQVVGQVDLKRYAGKWFDVAHSPNFFQRKCIQSTAEYEAISATELSVLNTCYKANGKISSIDGVASIVDQAEPAKLRVRFDFIRKGDYWITELDPNYQWAVVSGPGKKYNFILSRTAPMPKEQLDSILEVLKSKGFETDEFVFGQY